MKSRSSNHRLTPPMVGGSSLLIIFAVLCLTIFTLLSLSTVQANARLSESSIKAVTDYYQADNQAEEIFALLRSGQIPAEVQWTEISANTTISEDSFPTGRIYSYFCPISDTQILSVQLHQENGIWTVLRWQAISKVTYE